MPHLRTLVERYQDRPFAVVGVNAFDDEKAYRDGVKALQVSWISAFQGDEALISELYSVTGYPTVFVLDHQGRIQAIDPSEEELDRTVARLVSAAEKAR